MDRAGTAALADYKDNARQVRLLVEKKIWLLRWWVSQRGGPVTRTPDASDAPVRHHDLLSRLDFSLQAIDRNDRILAQLERYQCE
jgi:hypothetical protein